MTIKEFCEKAIEGGWNGNYMGVRSLDDKINKKMSIDIHEADMLLDPFAWQAVGKVEGWRGSKIPSQYGTINTWETNMHRMINALISGQTLEE